MLQYKVNFDDLDWEEPLQGVRCKIFRRGGKQLRLVEYSKEMPLHWCEKGHCGYILDGIFEIEYRNGKVLYHTGDGVCIPDGKEHAHRARALSESVKAIFVENV